MKPLNSVAFLILIVEQAALAKSGIGGAEAVLKLSEKVLRTMGEWKDDMGVREMVEKAGPLLRDFFGTLKASGAIVEGLDLPPESSEK